MDRVPAEVWLLERGTEVSPWKIIAGPLAANVGRNGTGWGRDGSGLLNPGGYPEKQEGDGRSPAGVFPIPATFGSSPEPPVGVRLPWLACTDTLRGVDDPKSKYYNKIVDEAAIPDQDWDSAEIMRREDGLYDAGLVIGHNADRVPGAGSCIFLHIWKGPGQGTAGCTALAPGDVWKILTWLDPVREPRLVLGIP
jgi:L,D-peptidoglycan transpeptidase YkuD (ErfK/YbiS/YcfS/YnhG family)